MPMEATLFGIVIDVRLLHLSNTALPIDVTLLGIVTEFRPLQLKKALSPIEVTLYTFPPYVTVLGMVTLPEYSFGLLVTSAVLTFDTRL